MKMCESRRTLGYAVKLYPFFKAPQVCVRRAAFKTS